MCFQWVNSLKREEAPVIQNEHPELNNDIKLEDTDNLDASDIIKASSSNSYWAGNVKDDLWIYYAVNWELPDTPEYPAQNFWDAAVRSIAKWADDFTDWVEKAQYNSATNTRFKQDVAKNTEYVIKWWDPWWFTEYWESWNPQWPQPYIDVLKWRDDVIGQIYNNILDDYPNPDELTNEQWYDIWNRFYILF